MNRPLVGVGVFIIKNEGTKTFILLGKRKGSHGAGEWSLPGGHLEGGEDFQDCCRREVFEETGMTLKDFQKVTFTNNLFPNDKKHYVTLFFKADYADQFPYNMEPDKCEGWEWFDVCDLPRPLFGGIVIAVNYI